MKLFHLSDLHLGKRLGESSLLEDQQFVLDRILELVDAERPDAVLICGDVYDRAMPPEEAVRMLDRFLVALSRRGTPVFVISGNHDSADRLSFGGRLMGESGVHLAPLYDGRILPLTLEDAFGPVRFWLLPYLRLSGIRRAFPDLELNSCTDGFRAVVASMAPDPRERNVLLAHQFVTGAIRSESETVYVGGEENVDAEVFAPFDYVALGHLHAPQDVGSRRIRYCGTPLKYSLSERDQQKSVTVAELGPKGTLEIRTLPLTPLRDLRELRGSFAELLAGPASDDYIYLCLTDENEIMDAMTRLHQTYPNALQLRYDNRRTAADQTVEGADQALVQDPMLLFGELYTLQNNEPMSRAQEEYLRGLVREIWGDER